MCKMFEYRCKRKTILRLADRIIKIMYKLFRPLILLICYIIKKNIKILHFKFYIIYILQLREWIYGEEVKGYYFGNIFVRCLIT